MGGFFEAACGPPDHRSLAMTAMYADTIAARRDAASTRRVQIVMDRFGDTRHEFDAADGAAVALAEERFRQLTRSGFRAAALSSDGSPGRLIKSFDKEVERTLFIPQLQGG
jgi:hypothetical protein